MAPEGSNQDERLDQVQDRIPELVDRYWRLARSAANGEIANGNAAFEMAEILHALSDVSEVLPFSLVRSKAPDDCDIVMSNVSVLAENLWLVSYIKFGEKNRYFPSGYIEERDQLMDGRTQKLEVKEAGKSGQGLYARKTIKEEEIVFTCSGKRKIFSTPYESTELIEIGSIKEKSARPRRFLYKNPREHYLPQPRNPDSLYPNAICIDQEDLEPLMGMRPEDPTIKANIWLDPFGTCPLRFLNHSCEPTVKRRADGVTFVAMRAISPGEQLTCDYSTLEVNPDWKMKCQCGSPQCRGIIGGIQSLPVELLEKYGNDLPRFMLDLFRGSHPEIGREVYDEIRWTRGVLGVDLPHS